MSDFRDILQLPKTQTAAVTPTRQLFKTSTKLTDSSKKKANADIPREVRMLTNGATTLQPTSFRSPYKEKRTIIDPAKKYVYRKFRARNRGPFLKHWEKEEDKEKEYPFKELNKRIRIFKYNNEEYEKYVKDLPTVDGETAWTREETDELFSLCEQFDLRWVMIKDRFQGVNNVRRTKEQLKNRYYSAATKLLNVRLASTTDPVLKKKGMAHPILANPYDYNQDAKRTAQMQLLASRPENIVQQEAYIKDQLAKIEKIKKKRMEERKALEPAPTVAATQAAAPVAIPTPEQPQKKKRGRKPKAYYEEQARLRAAEAAAAAAAAAAAGETAMEVEVVPVPPAVQTPKRGRRPREIAPVEEQPVAEAASASGATMVIDETEEIKEEAEVEEQIPEDYTYLAEQLQLMGTAPGSVVARSTLLGAPKEKLSVRIDKVLNELLPVKPPFMPTNAIHQMYNQLRKKCEIYLEKQKQAAKKGFLRNTKKAAPAKKSSRRRSGSSASADDDANVSPTKKRRRE